MPKPWPFLDQMAESALDLFRVEERKLFSKQLAFKSTYPRAYMLCVYMHVSKPMVGRLQRDMDILCVCDGLKVAFVLIIGTGKCALSQCELF